MLIDFDMDPEDADGELELGLVEFEEEVADPF